VVNLLNRMEERGLVKRSKDLHKKNLVRIALTDKGEEAFVAACQTSAISRLMSALSEEQRERLAECLWVLRGKALDELHLEEPPFPQRPPGS